MFDRKYFRTGSNFFHRAQIKLQTVDLDDRMLFCREYIFMNCSAWMWPLSPDWLTLLPWDVGTRWFLKSPKWYFTADGSTEILVAEVDFYTTILLLFTTLFSISSVCHTSKVTINLDLPWQKCTHNWLSFSYWFLQNIMRFCPVSLKLDLIG